MITQTIDQQHFMSRQWQITAQIPNLLSQWGLIQKFKQWRLMQDTEIMDEAEFNQQMTECEMLGRKE